MAQISRFSIKLIAASLFAIPTVALAAKPTKNLFDGDYAVEVLTAKGSCDKIARVAIAVTHGQVAAVAGMPMQAIGHVDARGKVALRIRYNDQEARAAGWIVGSIGSGTWSSAQTACGGSWHAERVE